MLVIDEKTFSDFPRWKYNRLAAAPISTIWTESATPEPKIHRIHAYPARFPSFLVHRAFEYAAQQGVGIKKVADLFCGSGTVACEAGTRGLEFWGCDINPIATLIARVKCAQLDPLKFEQQMETILRGAQTASTELTLSASAVDRLRPWFEPEQFDALARLRNAIRAEVGDESADSKAFECAFSAILKQASQWRVRSIKPSRDLQKRATPVGEAFQRQCKLMAAAWSEVSLSNRSKVTVVCGNVMDVERPSSSVDIIVTSPPYATSYEYPDLHQLSALWLGFVDDHRDLRAGVIGASTRRADLTHAMQFLNSVAMQIVFSLYDKNRALAEATAEYFLDMQKVAKRAYEFLRPGGISVFVIGNTQLNGVRIDNANHLVESLLDAGFMNIRVVKRQVSNKPNTPYRLANGRLSSAPSNMQIYAEEYIVMAQRP
jgi:methylase of polypeptide subunit release factors